MSKKWSGQQEEIFSWFKTGKGHAVVRARAGTGKTTTAIEAVKHAPEGKILFCAFNKKNAVELDNRITTDNCEAKTFHSLGFAFIRRQWNTVRPDDDVEFDRARKAAGVYAPDEMVKLIRQVMGKVKNCAPFASLSQVTDIMDNFDLNPDDEWVAEGWDADRIGKLVLGALEISKQKDDQGRISFDDMIWLPVVNNWVRAWYDMVIVDEAQDTNICQLIIARRTCKEGGRIVVIGDDRQAIYGFRGADSGALDRLKSELNAHEMGLTITYRCGKNIVERAQAIVPDYQAAPDAHMGTVDTIGVDKLYEQAQPGDFILSRKNAPLMGICLSFLRRGQACRIEGRDVGQGLVAIVRKLRAKSLPDFAKKLNTWEMKQVKKASSSKNKEAKIENIRDQRLTLEALAEGVSSVKEIETRILSLFSDSESTTRPAIVCSSVHKAKGLEADRAFLIIDTFCKRPDIEEMNILYVGITRARHHLTYVPGIG